MASLDLPTFKQAARRWAAWLQAHHPTDLLMPVKEGTKQPLHPHKDGQWSWEKLEAWLEGTSAPADLAILCRSLVCIDADSREAAAALEASHPAFTTCPSETTRKGKHYWFKRSALCDSLGMYNGRIHPDLDFLSVWGTGTAGLTVIAPSTGKAWERDLLGTPLPEMPAEVAEACYAMRSEHRGAAAGGASAATAPIDAGEHEGMVEAVEGLLDASGTHPTFRFRGVTQLANGAFSLEFCSGRAGRECLCTPGEHHTRNFFVHCHPDGVALYRCISSECAQKRAAFLGHWKPLQLEFAGEEEATATATPKFDKALMRRMLWGAYGRGEEPATPATEAQAFAYFNRHFCFVGSGNGEVVELIYDPAASDTVVGMQRRSIKGAAAHLSNVVYPRYGPKGEPAAPRPFFDLWNTSLLRREARRLVYNPHGTAKPDQLNVFLGLRVEREHPGLATMQCDASRIQRVLHHVREVLCAGHAGCFDYVMTWLRAVVVEKRRTGTALVFCASEQGTGKGIFIDQFLGERVMGTIDTEGEPTLGEPYVQLGDVQHMVGRFNTLSQNRLLINADEASSNGGAFKESSRLKGLITELIAIWESKGLDAVMVRNYANYIFTTNDATPVKVACGDRRFFVRTPSDRYKGDAAYFAALLAEVRDPAATAHFYKYLEAFDAGVDLRCIPETEERMEMMATNVPLPCQFLREQVEAGAITSGKRKPTAELWDEFSAWANRCGHGDHRYKKQTFGSELQRLPHVARPRGGQVEFTDVPALVAALKAKQHWFD